MQVELKQKHKLTEEEVTRFELAKQDFAKMMKEIAPFIKKQEKVNYSSTGYWRTSETEQMER